MTNFIGWTPPPGVAVVPPPVHPKTWVSVLYSDGQFSKTDYEADTFNWSSVGDGPRVVAYAVVEEYVGPKVARKSAMGAVMAPLRADRSGAAAADRACGRSPQAARSYGLCRLPGHGPGARGLPSSPRAATRRVPPAPDAPHRPRRRG